MFNLKNSPSVDTKKRNSLNSTQVHNADDDGCFDEKQYEEINRLSQESLEWWRNAVLPAWGKQSQAEVHRYWTQTNISHLLFSQSTFAAPAVSKFLNDENWFFFTPEWT